MRRPKHDNRHRAPYGYETNPPLGVIIHCTVSDPRPGPGDRHGIIDYLASKGLSVPLVVDDESGTEMVPRPYGGFHCAGVRRAHGIEIIGQATWTEKQWMQHSESVIRAAQESAWFLHEVMGLPVTRKNLKRFVIGHVDDHKFGGTSDHWDPGPGFPWAYFNDAAIAYAVKVRYVVTATKDDERKARKFRVKRAKQARAWAWKKVKRGWRVRIQRKRLRADLED